MRRWRFRIGNAVRDCGGEGRYFLLAFDTGACSHEAIYRCSELRFASQLFTSAFVFRRVIVSLIARPPCRFNVRTVRCGEPGGCWLSNFVLLRPKTVGAPHKVTLVEWEEEAIARWEVEP